MERSPDPKVLTKLNTSQGHGAQKTSAVGHEEDAKLQSQHTKQLIVGTRTNFVHGIVTFDPLPV